MNRFALAGLAVVAVAVAVASYAAAHAAHEPGPGLSHPEALQPRGPILIAGDAGFTPANGVRYGLGTAADPFVIENWTVEGTGPTGILIRDVRAEFLLRNVRVSDAHGADFFDAIRLENVTKSMVDQVEVVGQGRFGVYIEDSDQAGVCSSRAEYNGFVGFYAHASSNMVWREDFAARNTKHGFYLANESSNNRITDASSFDHTGHGSASFGAYSGLHSNDNVFDNITAQGNGAGIQLNLAMRNLLRDNVITGNLYRGISLTNSWDPIVEHNVLADNGIAGVMFSAVEGGIVRFNDIQDHATGSGVHLQDPGDARVHGNTIRNNAFGIHIMPGAGQHTVYDNLFENAVNALDEQGGSVWSVTKRAGPNVIGDAWIGGNWWSDLPADATDEDGDGLAEAGGGYTSGLAGAQDALPIASDALPPLSDFTFDPPFPMTLAAVTFTADTEVGFAPVVSRTWRFADGTLVNGATATHVFFSSGDHPVVLEVTDERGVSSVKVRQVPVANQPPVVAFAHAVPLVTNTPVVTLDATPSHDGDGAIVTTEWTFGDGATGRGASVTHTYPGDGRYAASVLVTDDRGAATARSVLVVVDGAAPITVAAVTGTPGASGWWLGTATVTLTAGDATSGVAASEWRTGADAWRPYTSPFTLGAGEHDVHYRSHDVAGVTETARRLTVRVDAAAPVTTVAAPTFVAAGARLPVSATDDASGVARTNVRVGDGPWRAVHTAVGVPFEDGPVSIEAWSRDVAGRTEPARTFTVTVDGTAPEVALTAPTGVSVGAADAAATTGPPPAGPATAGAVVVGGAWLAATATDAASGVADVAVFVDGVLVARVTGDALRAWWTVPEAAPRDYVVTVSATDAVGNTATTTHVVLGIGLVQEATWIEP